MFIALPEAFNLKGRFNTAAFERYFKDEVAAHSGRYQIVIAMLSNQIYTAVYDDAEERDRVFEQFDRFVMGKDKVPQYDALED